MIEQGAMLPVNTGYVGLDIVVYIVSGGAFIVLCLTVPIWLRDRLREIRAWLDGWRKL